MWTPKFTRRFLTRDSASSVRSGMSSPCPHFVFRTLSFSLCLMWRRQCAEDNVRKTMCEEARGRMLLLASLFALLLLAAECVHAATNRQDEIVLGMSTALSGPAADLGLDMRQGV